MDAGRRLGDILEEILWVDNAVCGTHSVRVLVVDREGVSLRPNPES
jgi:hypothetical protein